MRARKPEPQLEEIPEAECVEILRQHNVGRIGFVVDGWPQIFPVNYGWRAAPS